MVVLLAVQVPIVLIPVTLAIILAATLLPIYRRLRARGWSPTSAAGTVTVASIVITTVVVVLTVVSLATQMGPIVAAASVGAGQAIASDPQLLAWLQPLVSSSSDFLRQAGQALVAGSVGLSVVCVIGVLLTAPEVVTHRWQVMIEGRRAPSVRVRRAAGRGLPPTTVLGVGRPHP